MVHYTIDPTTYRPIEVVDKSKEKKHPVKPLLNPLTINQILQDWKAFKELQGRRVANFYAFLYLTGARISEVNQVRRSDIQLLTAKKIMLVEMPTLKNRRDKTRTLVIPLIQPYTPMVKDLWEWLQLFEPYDIIFPYSRQHLRRWLITRKVGGPKRGWKTLKAPLIKTTAWFWGKRKKMFYQRPYYPHFLRHCRLTHLVKHHHFGSERLKYWAGWSDVRLAEIYVRLDWTALEKQIKTFDFFEEALNLQNGEEKINKKESFTPT